MTLIEMLVVIAILALLAALLVPAVMESRKAADRLKCASNLRQIAQATAAYHGLFNSYPAYFNSGGGRPVPGQSISKNYSVFSRIAPQLELTTIYDHINFQVVLSDEPTVGQDADLDLSFRSPANATVMGVAVPVLFCPSDSAVSGTAVCRGTNYRANYGIYPGYGGNLHLSGPFTYWGPVSAADVTDGLSRTAAYSEKPRGDAQRSSFDPFVDPMVDPVGIDPPASVWFEYCDRQPVVPKTYRTTTGINWLVGGLTQTCYNHMEAPNGGLPDCVKIGHYPGTARSTARSRHGAGANVAMADGSIRFVTETIDLKIWRALGTRGGGEVIPDEW